MSKPSVNNSLPKIANAFSLSALGSVSTFFLANCFPFDEKKLVENKWGILEPSRENQDKIEPKEIDLVIIPLLIFDKNGNRVGYGKGFYDRFLQQCNPKTLKIGICLEDPIEMIKDVDKFDVKMNFCITPNKIYRF